MITITEDVRDVSLLTECQLRIAELEKCCTQRGARMQLMRNWMMINDHEDSTMSCWEVFCYDKEDEPSGWFHADGVPK